MLLFLEKAMSLFKSNGCVLQYMKIKTGGALIWTSPVFIVPRYCIIYSILLKFVNILVTAKVGIIELDTLVRLYNAIAIGCCTVFGWPIGEICCFL